MDILIKGARIVDYKRDFIGDVYIKSGTIYKVGTDINIDCEVINGEGLVLLPSFIDLHAHFRDPGLTYKEDIYSGSLAAVKGGYTAVNLMANTKPVCSTMEIVDYVLKEAKETGLVDVHQCVSVTRNFDGCDIGHLDSIDETIRFVSDDGNGVQNDIVMLKAMEKAKSKGITIISHAENKEINAIDSRLSENIMTVRDIALAKYTGCHLHMAHVSTKEAMEEIINAKRQRFSITCEVMPHNIALTGEVTYRVNPPLRNRDDVNFLISAIKEGWVDAIATDHAPHSVEDKLNGAPGISGLEVSFPVCFTTLVKGGHITLSRLTELMSRNPANLMGINKGEIQEGFDGDLVLVDIEKSWVIDTEKFVSKGKNTPFNGMEFYGSVVKTIKGGKIVYSEEEGHDN